MRTYYKCVRFISCLGYFYSLKYGDILLYKTYDFISMLFLSWLTFEK